MTILFWGVLEIVATFLESFFCYRFNSIFTIKRVSKKSCAFLSLILSLIIYVLNCYSLYSISTLLIAIMFISISQRVIFKISLFDSLAISSFYSVCVLLFDFFAISILSVILNDSSLINHVTQEKEIYRYIFIIVSKFFLILSYFIIKKLFYKRQSIQNKKILLLTFFGYIGIIYISKLTFKDININIVISWLSLIIIIFLGFFLMVIILLLQGEKAEKDAIKLKSEIVSKNYIEMAQDYKENAQLFHDINNHLVVLQNLIDSGDYQMAKEYMSGLSNVNRIISYTWTGNGVIDCILNSKKAHCDKSNIPISLDVDPVDDNLDNFVVSTVLSNLLDNSIEACQENSEDSWIIVIIRHINNMLIIKIENSISCEPAIDKDGFLRTNKSEHKKHGLGIKSVKTAVERVGGVFTYSWDKGEFSSVVTLFL